MDNQTAFKPLTKEDIGKILGISNRCIENWVNAGTLIPPVKLGNRIYWHPDVFYAWLTRQLTQPEDVLSPETANPVKRPAPVASCTSTQPRKDGGTSELMRITRNTERMRTKLLEV
jgi:predicted DNA-binding transcriptional regulator AlpA